MSYNSLFGLGTHSPDADLIGLWNCQDNAASTTLTDDSGLGRDGVCSANTFTMSTTGPTAWLPLGIDWFTGASNYATVAYDAAMNSSALSVGGWMWRQTGTQPLASRYLTTGNQRSWRVSLADNSMTGLMSSTGSGATSITSTVGTDSSQQWSNVAFVSDGTNAFGYANGTSGTSVASQAPYAGTADLSIAKNSLPNGTNASLKMAGLWMFTRDLTVAELDEARLGPEPINLTAPVLSQSTYRISTTDGTWDSQANGVVYYSYSWEYADDASGTNPVALSSTGSEIDAIPEMSGKFIRVTVSASNDGGSDSAEDQATAWTAVTAASRGLGKEKTWWCPSLQDDSATLIVNDLTVNGYNLFNINTDASNWVADTDNGGVRAVDLNGTDEYHTVASPILGLVGTDFSLSIWTKKDDTSSGHFFGLYDTTGGPLSTSQNHHRIGHAVSSGNGTNAGSYGNFSPSRNIAAKDSITNNPTTWRHLAGTFSWSGSTLTITLFIDGVEIDQTTESVNINDPMDTVCVGSNLRGGVPAAFLNGRWDDARIFDSVLTRDDITHLASARGVEGAPGGGGPTFQPAWAFQATVVAL